MELMFRDDVQSLDHKIAGLKRMLVEKDSEIHAVTSFVDQFKKDIDMLKKELENSYNERKELEANIKVGIVLTAALLVLLLNSKIWFSLIFPP